VSEVKQRVDLVSLASHSTIYIFIKMYVRAQRFFAVAFRIVSQTCPVIPMPENANSFDPTKCEWTENEN